MTKPQNLKFDKIIKTKSVTKLKKNKCDKYPNVTKLINSKCSKTQRLKIVKIKKKSNCDITQKNQIMTKLYFKTLKVSWYKQLDNSTTYDM